MKFFNSGIKNFYHSRFGLHILVVLMSIALVGIGLVQWLWIDSAVQVREAEYDEKVQASMETIIRNLERKQQVIFISEKLGKTTIVNAGAEDTSAKKMPEYFSLGTDSSRVDSQSYIDMNATFRQNSTVESDLLLAAIDYPDDNHIIKGALDSFFLDTNKRITHIKINKKEDVFSNMILEYEFWNDPVEKRINISSLDEIIQRVLADKSLGTDYAYALWNRKNDSIIYHSPNYRADYVEESYLANLFPDDYFAKDDFLLLYVPGKSKIVLSSLKYLLFGSVTFTLIIVVLFFITVNFASKQKEISRIKTDFINNMTHEFKTPIATISLAADAIKNPRVIQDIHQTKKFLKIIKEENQRMNKQVERILQISLLEKEKMEFHPEPSDIKILTGRAVQNFELIVKEKNGSLTFTSDESEPTANVDEIHFLNVLHNLLDNAIKYSKEKPFILVELFTENKQVHILVKDKGMGIRKENQQNVFDKFFRETSGDVHDIKGFGLGLSYVKSVVKAFNGQVRLSSIPGKGSTFEIILPEML
ncbi:MAG: HAMP domain-containing sensor histidine kinase [Bacteroidota bacterium]|nr:HAMP domain-containing sensor histidine kinase [Bacteroidota bacterium]